MDLEKWQLDLEEHAAASAAAAISATLAKPRVHPDLLEIDQEVITLCADYTELDVLASEEMIMPDTEERFLRFTDLLVRDCAVEVAYAQFLKLADKTIDELMAIGWGHALDRFERIVDPIKYAHEMQDLPRLALILTRNLTNLKATCESCAHNAMKTNHVEAGEMLLLTALAARELQNALSVSPAAIS